MIRLPPDPVGRLIGACRTFAEGSPVRREDLRGAFGQTISVAELSGVEFRAGPGGFGLGLAAILDGTGTSVAVFHDDGDETGPVTAAAREGRICDLATLLHGMFREARSDGDRLVPAGGEGRMRRSDDAAAALLGAVIEAMPETSFASSMIEWSSSRTVASFGCDLTIDDRARPTIGIGFESVVASLEAPLVLRSGSAWEAVADQIVPDVGSSVRLGVAIMDASTERQVERDALSYLRAVSDGREACRRLGIPADERILLPPI